MKLLTSGGLAAILATIFSTLPLAAMAHDGTGAHFSLMHGFLHPLTGLDHVLAMVAVGVIAAQFGGRARLLVPGAFVLAMIAGAAAGHGGVPLPMVEPGIALSVIILGLALALGLRLPAGAAMALVAIFAVFHGHAHGSEGAAVAGFLPYAGGFIAATALLHVAGIALGLALDRRGGMLAANSRRMVGAISAVAGVVILLG